MTIVVGYSPSGQGRAALRAALRYAARNAEGMAIASHQYHDPERGLTAATEDEVRAELERIGIECGEVAVHTSAERDIGEFLLSVIDEVEASLIVIGLRRKPHRQAESRCLRAPSRARSAVSRARRQGRSADHGEGSPLSLADAWE